MDNKLFSSPKKFIVTNKQNNSEKRYVVGHFRF